jgi:exonuclease VII small subunit
VPKRNSPYSVADLGLESSFDTWEEAKDYLVARCQREMDKAEKEFLRAEAALERAKGMEPPK